MKICYDYTVMGFVPKHIADEAKEVAYRELGYQLVKMALQQKRGDKIIFSLDRQETIKDVDSRYLSRTETTVTIDYVVLNGNPYWGKNDLE